MRPAAGSDRRVATLFALVAASGFCVALVVARMVETGTANHRFLVWNLVLAWIPFLLAIAFYDGYRRGRSGAFLLALGALWLLFLPNAPYLVTDLIHLGEYPEAPLWFDAGMLASFAVTGVVLGLGSLLLVQLVLARALGARVAWAAALGVICLSSVGVYIGRFLRLNSWDALLDPSALLGPAAGFLADPLGAPRFLAGTVLFSAFLGLAYALLYNVVHLSLTLEPRRR
jgi:uncharacterized membrane protein